MPATPSRRCVVAAAIAVPVTAAAGCTLSGPKPQRTSSQGETEVDPDVVLLSEVAAATKAMVELYEAVLDEHRGLRGELRPLLAAHRVHARALGEAAPADVRSPRVQERRERERRRRLDVPGRATTALRRVRAAERDLAAELMDACLRATSGDLARLLASMSASSGQNARVLTEAGGR